MNPFTEFGLMVNIALFAVSAALVWIAGSRLSGWADAVSRRTGAGEALVGLILLAGVTSLPEIATSFTAAGTGDAPLAVNNLLGSVAMQIAVLAAADAVYGKRALTSVVPDPVVMLQGALNVCLLCGVAMAALTADLAVAGAGLWTWGLAIGAIYSFRKLAEAGGRQPWVANTEGEEAVHPEPETLADSHLLLGIKIALAALVILAAGSAVSLAGQAIADQSGIGSSFVGYAFVAIATSLPEASTVAAALRRGLYTMAISDILGTNILNVALLFFVDLIAADSPVLGAAGGNFAATAAVLGAAVTALFLMGLAERRDRTVFKMGIDSALVLVVYAGGMALLYTMRPDA